MIREALEQQARVSTRVWEHDRSQTIGASEIGQCARKMWFSKHGQEPDPAYVDRWGAKKRGDLIEAFWVQALRRYFGPGVLRYAGRYQKTFIDPETRLSATPDGLACLPDECFLVECKSIDPRAKLEEARPEHVYQVHVQLGLVRELTRYRPTHGLLSYVDASFLDESCEFRIDFDPAVYAQAKTRAHTIFAANTAEALRPEGYIAGSAECSYCPFRGSCSAMRAGAVPGQEERLGEAALARLVTLARERAERKRQAELNELAARVAEEEIKEILRAAGTRRAEGQGVRVVWSALKGRPAFDMPALRAAAVAAGLDLAPFERTGEPSDRLQVTLTVPARQTAA